MFVVLVGFVAPALAMATLSIHKTEQRTADEYSVSTFTTQCRIEQESLIQTRMRETGDVTSLLPTLTPCVYEISDDKFAVVEAEAVEQGGVVTLTLSSYYGLASDSTVYSFTLHQHIEEGWQVVGFTEDGVAIWGPPLDPPYETVQIPAEEYENPTPPEEDPEP